MKVELNNEDEVTVRRIARIRRVLEDLVDISEQRLRNGASRPAFPLDSVARAGCREIKADADWLHSLLEDSALAGELELIRDEN